jgi:hypothetical protein
MSSIEEQGCHVNPLKESGNNLALSFIKKKPVSQSIDICQDDKNIHNFVRENKFKRDEVSQKSTI